MITHNFEAYFRIAHPTSSLISHIAYFYFSQYIFGKVKVVFAYTDHIQYVVIITF